MVPSSQTNPVVRAALNQAKRARRRGKHRQAMLLLRKAAFQEHENAALWTRYALSCVRDGRTDEAKKAFSQAIWLDRKHGNHRRAAVTETVAERALSEAARPN